MMGKRLSILVVTMALVVASCGGGTIETAAAESDAVGTGIGVHGAWTVTVYGLDGSEEHQRQFHNDLLGVGAEELALQLATGGFPDWRIELQPRTDSNQCPTGDALFSGTCFSVDRWLNEWISPSVEIGADSESILLAGEVEVTEQNINGYDPSPDSGLDHATIDGVATYLRRLAGNGDPISSSYFTSTRIDPIPVDPGQTVQVEVEISFGTLTTP